MGMQSEEHGIPTGKQGNLGGQLWCEVDRTGEHPEARVLDADAEEIAGAWSPVLSAEHPEGNCMSFSALLPEMGLE